MYYYLVYIISFILSYFWAKDSIFIEPMLEKLVFELQVPEISANFF